MGRFKPIFPGPNMLLKDITSTTGSKNGNISTSRTTKHKMSETRINNRLTETAMIRFLPNIQDACTYHFIQARTNATIDVQEDVKPAPIPRACKRDIKKLLVYHS